MEAAIPPRSAKQEAGGAYLSAVLKASGRRDRFEELARAAEGQTFRFVEAVSGTLLTDDGDGSRIRGIDEVSGSGLSRATNVPAVAFFPIVNDFLFVFELLMALVSASFCC